MTRKYSKRNHVKRLRRLLSEVIHLRDKVCQRCNKADGKLDTSHIFPKGSYPSLQFLPDNVKLLCFRCHRIFWHNNPVEASKWLLEYLTPSKYEHLRSLTQQTNTINRPFLEQSEIMLKEYRAELLGDDKI